jgi:hypothetical protein
MESRMAKLLEDYLTEDELAEELGVTVRTLQGWRQARKGPPWTRMGGSENRAGRVLYPRPGISPWLQANTVQPARERIRKSA